jgi:hypothetical protein
MFRGIMNDGREFVQDLSGGHLKKIGRLRKNLKSKTRRVGTPTLRVLLKVTRRLYLSVLSEGKRMLI